MAFRHPLIFTLVSLIFLSDSIFAQIEFQVDFQKIDGKIKHNALGFLHALGKTGDVQGAYPEKYDDEFLKPLAPIWFRGTPESLSLIYPRMTKYRPTSHFVVELHNKYQSDKHLPWENNFKEWDAAVLKSVETTKKYPIVPIYDFINEPEQFIKKIRNNTSSVSEDELWSHLFELYVHTYHLVKKFHPGAKITGPGFGYPDFSPNEFERRMTEFKNACVHNDCLPNYWNYHMPHDQVDETIELFKSWNLPQVSFLLCEYLGPATYKLPAANFETFAYYESLPQLEGGMRATWIRWGEKFATLGGSIGMDTPKHESSSKYFRFGTWYCYKAYSEMDGNRYHTESPKPLRILAGDLKEGYRLLIGSQNYSEIKDRNKAQGPSSVNFTGTVLIHIQGLQNEKYTATLQEIPQPGSQSNKEKKFNYSPVNSLPSPLIEDKAGGRFDVQINWKNANSGWYLDLVPEK